MNSVSSLHATKFQDNNTEPSPNDLDQYNEKSEDTSDVEARGEERTSKLKETCLHSRNFVPS